MQKFSLHTHTIGFDGKHTEEQMLKQAKDLGWSKIGFSNHFIVCPYIKETKMYEAALQRGYQNIYSSSFEEAIEKFKPHYERIDELKEKTGFPIYKGMEVDFFRDNEWREGFEKACAVLKPDYLIGSAHFVAANKTLYNTHDLKNAPKEEQNLLLHKYFQNVRAAAKSGLFNFLAHLDLMKKVGLGREDMWLEDELKTVETIAKAGARAEINTSGFKLAYGEPYPSKRIMGLLAKHKVPVIISDDAHNFERLGERFAEAEQMARDAGIKKFYDPFEIRPQNKINERSL
ncbi:MAG: histidinol-phosphatase HisJ family protein [Alphaproteobacteria bacterium]|nr:histidinol-phosphatase HisJ family protein [Alphaproteobacteria bacterium]